MDSGIILDARFPHNNWLPRVSQVPFWNALVGMLEWPEGPRRFIEIAHRRWGKDEVCMHAVAAHMAHRPATYWHMLPEAAQARKAIWQAINPHTGIRRIFEAFPRDLMEGPPRESDMLIRYRNGATYQVVGSDNYNSLVGAPPYGCIFSEWALANPNAWAFVRPVLLENGGWAAFVTTPRGRNHAATMYDEYVHDPDWFVEMHSARDTGIFTAEQLDQERREYIKEWGPAVGSALFRQEYLVSFDAPILGAYYAEKIDDAEAEGRIGKVPCDGSAPVVSAWDLGVSDNTSIWFFQRIGRELRFLRYYSFQGVGLDHYLKEIEGMPFHCKTAIIPHDGEARDFTSGTTARQIMQNWGFATITVPRRMDVHGETVPTVRAALSRCVFDREGCKEGLNTLRQYRSHYDEKMKVLRPAPLHDWASHGADAFSHAILGEPMLPRSGRGEIRRPAPRRVGIA